ncbi:MAG: BspA family leucine-rich repeat surface protein, partial [Bacilli bacterium]|nr:BspA family leucine-rich repeat surface protein [Bacilli bacterium]
MKDKKVYKTDKKGIIISLLIFSFVLMLSVGYAALNEELTISGEAHFRVESDIRITDVRLSNTINSASEDYASLYGKESMKVGATLPNNNSSATYKVKITNYSNVAMQLKSITKEIENNNYTITFNKTLPLTVGKLSEEEIEITFKNNTNTSQTINANLLFTFAKLESMMTTGTNGGATSTFFRGPIAKNTVSSITFVSTKEIPEDAVGYWDCSYVQGKNEVIAYYLNSETEGMYDLYIAADGEVYAPSNSGYLFQNFNKAVSINFNNSFNTSKVTNMGTMFYNCSSVTNIDLSKFNTSSVTNMSSMFNGCSSLVNLDISNFVTSSVTNMSYMFYNCSSVTNIDLSKFNTSSVTNMSSMFNGCS